MTTYLLIFEGFFYLSALTSLLLQGFLIHSFVLVYRSLIPGSWIAAALFNPGFTLVISLAVLLAVASSLNATILASSRIYYAMSEDSIFWTPLKRLHDRYDTPHISILVQGLVACGLVLLGTFGQLLSYVVFVMLFSSIASGMAHLVLRRRRPTLPRPYRTWGYPYIPLLFILSYGWIAFQIGIEKPETSFIGLLITLSGLPFYYYWARSQKAEKGSLILSLKKEEEL